MEGAFCECQRKKKSRDFKNTKDTSSTRYSVTLPYLLKFLIKTPEHRYRRTHIMGASVGALLLLLLAAQAHAWAPGVFGGNPPRTSLPRPAAHLACTLSEQQPPHPHARTLALPVGALRARAPRLDLGSPAAASDGGNATPLAEAAADSSSLQALLLPVWLGVFVQMLGVGVTLSQLPLYLLSMGATPTMLGVTISCFSLAQMLGCPLLIALSARRGRLLIIRCCLAGTALASLLTALAPNWGVATAARVLAGFFAASVPVAQAAVTDVAAAGAEATTALGKVASAASLGIVAGPAFAALIAQVASSVFGIPDVKLPRFAFAASSALAAAALALSAAVRRPSLRPTPPPSSPAAAAAAASRPAANTRGASLAQPLARWTALICSWTVTLGVASYTLFATRFLGYGQPQINANASAAAAVAALTQLLLVPRAIGRLGEARACACGLLALGSCFAVAPLVRLQPAHALLYLSSRAGLALAETSNAGLSVKHSPPALRGRNLGLLQSTQAGGRVVSPLVAGLLYEASLKGGVGGGGALSSLPLGPPGALPFLVAGSLAMLTAPLPALLLAREEKDADSLGRHT